MDCYLCGAKIPEEELVGDEPYQICYECELREEYGV